MSRDDDAQTLEVPGTIDERALGDRPAAQDARLADRYRLTRLMGKGGMGEVIAARDEQIGRDVAVKRMKAARPSERAIQRFLREASIQGRLEHPAIPPVHEIGRDIDGLPFFVMKKLTGTTLARRLAGPAPELSRERALRAFADVCLAVEFAHARGVVHRDLNPHNIMLGDFGEVYVLDWGVAKVVGEPDGDMADVASGSGSGAYATQAGAAVGTPGYMAPEQVRGAPVDNRADVYALGCVLFEILAGEPLHPAAGGMTSALATVDARPSVRAPDRAIPPELDALCVQATAKDRAARLPAARELAERVQRFLDGDRDLALRRELARGHLERAHAAFAGAGDEPRRTAMREATAALALDPSLTAAAELVGRLMLEPPPVTPREVEAAIAAEDVRTARVNARGGTAAVAVSLACAPLIWWMAPGAGGLVAALIGALAANGALAIYNLRAARPRIGLAVIGNAITTALLALMFSPVLIAPGIAAVLAMAMVVTPRLSRLNAAAAVAALMIAGVIAPWLAELAGLVPSTIAVLGDGVLLRAPGLRGAEAPTITAGVLYAVGLVIGAAWMGEALRARIRQAHRHLHLQAWQLRQLVPR